MLKDTDYYADIYSMTTPPVSVYCDAVWFRKYTPYFLVELSIYVPMMLTVPGWSGHAAITPIGIEFATEGQSNACDFT